MKKDIQSITDILKDSLSFDDAAEKVKSLYDATLVLRERSYPNNQQAKYPGKSYHDYARYHLLVETLQDSTPDNAYLCNAEQGFHIVGPTESAVFVSEASPGDYTVELVVIRHVPLPGTRYTAPLLDWLKTVIQDACYNRRDVRPSHPGKMVQIGLNLGPRHAQVLGWAKSFTRKLTDGQKVQQDGNLIGGMSFLWALIRAYLPSDVVAPVQELLDADYPHLGTQNIPDGCGFAFEVDDSTYFFSTSERAPPEGFATAGYQAHAHTDPCSVKWGFSWTVAREISPDCILPADMGSAFVDAGLKVVIRAAPATLMAFQPEQLHGTTHTGGTINYGLSLTSTRRVYDAMQDFIKTNGVGFVEYEQQTNIHAGSDAE